MAKVFISHVNGDPSGDAMWPPLRDALAQNGLDVLVDRATLRPGMEWRQEIYTWIGLCDAAVILLTKQALADHNKYWVARETMCLFCRRAINPQLRILPVLLDGITFAELEASERFKDLQLKETECIIGAPGGDDVPAAVLSGLQGLSSTDSRLSRVSDDLKALLAKFQAPVLEGAAMRCANDLGAWERLDPWSGLAVKLVSLDIERLPDVLGYLAEADPSLTDKLEQIREILLANWVEIEAVQGLIEEGRRPCGERRKALILNAPEEEGERLAKLYLRRAFGPNGWWTLAPITGIIGETNDLADAASQLADEIEAALVRAISAINRERAYRVLRYYTDKGNPVVVTAAMPSSVSVLLPNLMTSFDFATFLWRRDIDAPANEQLPEENFRLLTPVVSREKYAKFTLIDDVLRDRLNRGSVGNRP